MEFEVKIFVRFKDDVDNPRDVKCLADIRSFGFDVSRVRSGKFFELVIESKGIDFAKAQVTEICERLLVNGVIEECVGREFTVKK